MSFYILVLFTSLLLIPQYSQSLKCYSCGWDADGSEDAEEVREKCWRETPQALLECGQNKEDPISIGSDELYGCYSFFAVLKDINEYGRGCASQEFYNCTSLLAGQRIRSGECPKFTGEAAKVCFRNSNETNEKSDYTFSTKNLEDYTICFCSTGDGCNSENKKTRSKSCSNFVNPEYMLLKLSIIMQLFLHG